MERWKINNSQYDPAVFNENFFLFWKKILA